MPLPLILLVIIISGFASSFLLLIAFQYSSPKALIFGFFLVIICLSLIIWCSMSYNNLQYNDIGVVKCYNIAGSQIILINEIPYNITKIFGKSFTESTNFKVKELNSNSLGINWLSTEKRVYVVNDANQPISQEYELR